MILRVSVGRHVMVVGLTTDGSDPAADHRDLLAGVSARAVARLAWGGDAFDD